MEQGERRLESVHLTIPTSGGAVSLLEFQYLLAWWRGVYVAAELVVEQLGIPEDAPRHAAELVADRLGAGGRNVGYALEEIDSFVRLFGMTEFEADNDVSILELRRTNPIDLLVTGLAIPLTAAVILSGGKIHVGPLKVELPAIGTGIEKLRKALAPATPSSRTINRLPDRRRRRPSG